MYDTLELTYSPVFRQVKNIKIANSDNTYKRTIETYSGFLNVAITLFFFLFYAICLGSFWVINAHPDKETLNRVLIVNVFFLLLLVYVWTI